MTSKEQPSEMPERPKERRSAEAHLLERVREGSRVAQRQLLSQLLHGAGDPDGNWHSLLAGLASDAKSADTSLETLLMAVDDFALARPAITTVLVNPDQVEDAMQLTLTAVERGISSFEGSARFTTWLYRVAKNEALMLVRHNASRPKNAGADIETRRVVPAGRISSILINRSSIRTAIDELPGIYKDVANLVLLEDLSYQQAANRLGINVGTIKSRLSTARDLLTKALER